MFKFIQIVLNNTVVYILVFYSSDVFFYLLKEIRLPTLHLMDFSNFFPGIRNKYVNSFRFPYWVFNIEKKKNLKWRFLRFPTHTIENNEKLTISGVTKLSDKSGIRNTYLYCIGDPLQLKNVVIYLFRNFVQILIFIHAFLGRFSNKIRVATV